MPGAVSTGHDYNFPRNFWLCPACARKGVYLSASREAALVRCKYCGRQRLYWPPYIPLAEMVRRMIQRSSLGGTS